MVSFSVAMVASFCSISALAPSMAACFDWMSVFSAAISSSLAFSVSSALPAFSVRVAISRFLASMSAFSVSTLAVNSFFSAVRLSTNACASAVAFSLASMAAFRVASRSVLTNAPPSCICISSTPRAANSAGNCSFIIVLLFLLDKMVADLPLAEPAGTVSDADAAGAVAFAPSLRPAVRAMGCSVPLARLNTRLMTSPSII